MAKVVMMESTAQSRNQPWMKTSLERPRTRRIDPLPGCDPMLPSAPGPAARVAGRARSAGAAKGAVLLFPAPLGEESAVSCPLMPALFAWFRRGADCSKESARDACVGRGV